MTFVEINHVATRTHAGADAPAGKLCELGLSLKGKVPDAAWACVGVTTLSLKGNHLGSLSPKLAQLSALRVLVHDAERRREPARGRVEINLHAIEPT